MADDVATLLESFFAEYDDEGPFNYRKQPAGYRVIEPSSGAGQIVFATREQPARRAHQQSPVATRPGLIAPMYGLPCHADAAWIARAAAELELCFLGDLGPLDLLVFAWLRAALVPKEVRHLGINDDYLARLDVVLTRASVPRWSPAERQAMPLVAQTLPEYRELVGPKCAAVLERGLKIEIDAVAGVLAEPGKLLAPA